MHPAPRRPSQELASEEARTSPRGDHRSKPVAKDHQEGSWRDCSAAVWKTAVPLYTRDHGASQCKMSQGTPPRTRACVKGCGGGFWEAGFALNQMLLGSRINSTIGYLGFYAEGGRWDEDGRAQAVVGKETSVSCLSWGWGPWGERCGLHSGLGFVCAQT